MYKYTITEEFQFFRYPYWQATKNIKSKLLSESHRRCYVYSKFNKRFT